MAKIHENVSQVSWMSNEDFIWSITLSSSTDELLRKIEADKLPLETCAEFCLGVTPYDKYKGHTPSQIENQVFHADYQKDETFKKLLAGNDVRRFPFTGMEKSGLVTVLGLAPQGNKGFLPKNDFLLNR